MADHTFTPAAGVTPASAYAPSSVAARPAPPAVLADSIDPATGELQTLASGVHPVDGQVVTRLRSRRGSGASLQSAGHRFRNIEKVDDAGIALAKLECEQLFRDLVANGSMRIDQVIAEPATGLGDGVDLYMRYTNLRTGKAERVAL